MAPQSKKRVGIILFQLGGPDSLTTVEPFLRNLFLDPDIIPLGPLNFIRGPLARYIAKKRTPPQPSATARSAVAHPSASSPNPSRPNSSRPSARTSIPCPSQPF